MKTDAAPKSEFHRLLATCYAEDAKPELAKALAENALYLADKNLSPADRQEGLLTRAGYLFRLHRTAECLALLDQIPPAAGLGGRATLLRGQILYEEAQSLLAKPAATAADRRHARHKLDLAIEAFRLAQSRDTVSNRATRQAMYLTGLCLGDLGDRRGALEQLERTAKLFAGYPEALAATLQAGRAFAAGQARCRRPGRLSPRAGGDYRSREFSQPLDDAGAVARAACWRPIAAIWRRGISRWPCS